MASRSRQGSLHGAPSSPLASLLGLLHPLCPGSNNQHRSPAVRFHSGSSSASASQQPTIPKRRRLVIDSDDEEGDIIPEDYEDDTTLTKEKGKGKAEEEEAAAPLTKTARRRFAQGQIKNSTDEWLSLQLSALIELSCAQLKALQVTDLPPFLQSSKTPLSTDSPESWRRRRLLASFQRSHPAKGHLLLRLKVRPQLPFPESAKRPAPTLAPAFRDRSRRPLLQHPVPAPALLRDRLQHPLPGPLKQPARSRRPLLQHPVSADDEERS
ncbi:hypothetical protein A4X13_0g8703 [Tilletia indica]|uniref:Uncharacterized protein n=1 Tax=Tilletia indica TaxID=43049 RepID=A0A8T8SDL1_9BASI|nr:hypothetical protein A4X13_0g8703 [Tilletia indica]